MTSTLKFHFFWLLGLLLIQSTQSYGFELARPTYPKDPVCYKKKGKKCECQVKKAVCPKSFEQVSCYSSKVPEKYQELCASWGDKAQKPSKSCDIGSKEKLKRAPASPNVVACVK